jgi:dihydrofolate reductase
MSPGELNTHKPTVTLHVVSSLDGFIARRDNSVSWLDVSGEVFERGVSDEIATKRAIAAMKSIDCYVLGSRTYEHALQLGWPYGETPTFVVTSRGLASERKSVEFYSGDLERLVDEKLAPRFRNVWVVGGAMLCQSFLRLGLVDEIRLAVMPVLLGDGLSLFGNSGPETNWRLKDVVGYKTGMIELWYGREARNG